MLVSMLPPLLLRDKCRCGRRVKHLEVLDVMIELAKSGMTMIVVTHEMGFARRTANRVVFMAEGQIVEQGTPDEFFTNAKSARAREFLGKILTH